MRCQPGDLAVIIKEEPGLEANIGAFVHVLNKAPWNQGWEVRCEYKRLKVRHLLSGRHYLAGLDEVVWIPDSFLRPIRNPGEQAIDETLLKTPVPVKEAQ